MRKYKSTKRRLSKRRGTHRRRHHHQLGGDLQPRERMMSALRELEGKINTVWADDTWHPTVYTVGEHLRSFTSELNTLRLVVQRFMESGDQRYSSPAYWRDVNRQLESTLQLIEAFDLAMQEQMQNEHDEEDVYRENRDNYYDGPVHW